MIKLLSVLLAAAIAGAFPQQSAPEFEAASIKPTKSSDDRISVRLNPGGRWVGINIPVTLLIQEAFDVRQSQILGGPSWMSGDRFDVEAKPESTGASQPTPEAMSAMFQSLLGSRFHLAFHRETRDTPAYALVAAKNGSKMKESEPGAKPAVNVGPNRFRAAGMSTQMLAKTLSRYVGRLVVDETGLTGTYDFTLEWAPDGEATEGPTIFTAIQEQLGLKLESKKVAVEMLVIDRLDHPDAN